jgi:energy-coupling factor transporter ATP-binding protein EcfA2
MARPIVEMREIEKPFGSVIALAGVSFGGGTPSGGEPQWVAIGRAFGFGAEVPSLDEANAALSVRRTALVPTGIDMAGKTGLGVVVITHNVRHAYAVGDRFTVWSRGRTLATAGRGGNRLRGARGHDGRRPRARPALRRARRHGPSARLKASRRDSRSAPAATPGSRESAGAPG